ncbi:superoxide dismutase, partial [Halobacterium salinarum]|nr:superoxide dismutase [Halobacterium salinarum]
PDRGSFVDAFFEVIDWDPIAANYDDVVSLFE